MAAIANKETYHYGLYEVFPAMAPANQQNSSDGYEYVLGNLSGDGRSALTQAAYQLLALLTTIAIGIVSGIITGEHLFLCALSKIINTKLNISQGRIYQSTKRFKKAKKKVSTPCQACIFGQL